jgi:hypothetical protein
MRKLVFLMSNLVLALLIGCSGNDQAPPPQPARLNMNNPTDQQQLQTMNSLAQEAKGSCSDSGMNSLAPILPIILAGAPTQQGFNIPMIPPITGDCSNSLINFIMMYTTMKNGEYANDPSTRPWFVSQLGGIVNRVGARLEQRLGRPLSMEEQQKLLQASWGLVQRDVINSPQMQPVKPAVCSGTVQFGLSC